jgi:hypothetical protein
MERKSYNRAIIEPKWAISGYFWGFLYYPPPVK